VEADRWSEQVIESILYLLWDLKLKVGHSARSLDEAIHVARTDHTARTAMVEARYVWGDQLLFDELMTRSGRRWRRRRDGFVTQKLKSATRGTGGWATAATWSSPT
jgi:[protein-PII] uridylyltransferase